MVKKILIISLVAVVAIAVAASAYNVIAGSAGEEDSSVVSSAPVSNQALVTPAPGASPQVGVSAQGSGAQAGAVGSGNDGQTGAAGQSRGRQSAATAQGGGQGRRYGQQSGQGQGGASSQAVGAQAGVPNPQAAQRESISLHGVVSNYTPQGFTLVTDDGQSIAVQLGNQGYVSDLGISLEEGQAVTVVGFYETSDSLAVSSLTLDSSGQTYALRDQANGRPMWAGGPKNH